MCYGWVWTVCSRSIDYTLLCNKLLRWAKVAWVFSNCTFISVLILYVGNIYIGTANNAGAILVVGRGLVVVPKLIHPLPPPLQSPETSPERVMDDTWMQASFLKLSTLQIVPWCQNEFRTTYSQVFLLSILYVSYVVQELNIQRPPTPTRGRPQPDLDRSSLAYIWS